MFLRLLGFLRCLGCRVMACNILEPGSMNVSGEGGFSRRDAGTKSCVRLLIRSSFFHAKDWY